MLGYDIFFQYGSAVWLLVLIFPLLYGLFALDRYRKQQINAYASHPILSQLLIPRASGFTFAKSSGWIFIWILSCLALMSPYGNIRYPADPFKTSKTPIPEVVFLVDTSASMLVPDGRGGKNRLQEAKDIMEDTISQLSGQTVSLYAFTSVLTPLVPPTLDYLFMRLAIKDLQIDEGDVGGTRFAQVLSSLNDQAFVPSSSKPYIVILLSDGGDTELETLTGQAREKLMQSILSTISHPQAPHMRFFSVGLGGLTPLPIPHVSIRGKPVLSKLESEVLQKLAQVGKGNFYNAQDWTSWSLSQELIKQIKAESMIHEKASAERHVTFAKTEDFVTDLYFQFPLGLALLFYAINLLLPDVRRL